MCELYYLDHFRPEVRAEAEETNEKMDVAVEQMRAVPASIDRVRESLAKTLLDIAFVRVRDTDSAAQERLTRYAGELIRKAKDNLNNDQEVIETLKVHLEEQLEDD